MELQNHITDEYTGINYTLQGDYYVPDLTLPEDNETRPVGRYGKLHGNYMKSHHRIIYTDMLTSGKLHSYLADINEQAQDMLELLVKQMAEKEGVNERLKATEQIGWVGAMNNIRNCAEEIVLKELIYQ